MGLDLEPWEPEETVGKLWHVWASGFDAPEDFTDQAVALTEIGRASCRERVSSPV